MNGWFLWRDGEAVGPLSSDELAGLVVRGDVEARTWLWHPQFGDWREAGSFDFLKRSHDAPGAADGSAGLKRSPVPRADTISLTSLYLDRLKREPLARLALAATAVEPAPVEPKTVEPETVEPETVETWGLVVGSSADELTPSAPEDDALYVAAEADGTDPLAERLALCFGTDGLEPPEQARFRSEQTAAAPTARAVPSALPDDLGIFVVGSAPEGRRTGGAIGRSPPAVGPLPAGGAMPPPLPRREAAE